ncbi:MAG: endonuclease/exonuclease/phosphatase family protein [Pseudomonadota bacterium]
MTSLRQIADFFDLSDTPSRSRGVQASDKRMRGIVDLHRWSTRDQRPPQRVSLRSLCDRHFDAKSRLIRILWFNTELLPAPSVKGSVTAARARDIAAFVAEASPAYDLVCLGEMIPPKGNRPNPEEVLLKELENRGHSPTSVSRGPQGTGGKLSAGLLTLSFGRRIAASQTHTFHHGTRFLIDRQANKGVLHVRMELGVVTVDVYSTHLASGALTLFASDAAVLEQQLGQVEEVRQFIKRTRLQSENGLVVLCGDFNIDANDSTSRFSDAVQPSDGYTSMADILDNIDLDEVWPLRGGGLNYTYYNRRQKNRSKLLSFVCPPDNKHCIDEAGILPTTLASECSRLDYFFLEKPLTVNKFNVDFARPRRVHLRRPIGSEARDRFPSVSDHLGLELTLLVSERR